MNSSELSKIIEFNFQNVDNETRDNIIKFSSFIELNKGSYLITEGMKEDFINKELNKSVDELYGKPYDEKKTSDCNKYIYKLIPESKAEIDKLVKSGIY